MNKAVCMGLSPLLNLCASGVLPSQYSITYLLYGNTYDPSRFRSETDDVVDSAKKIASYFGYELNINGPYNRSFPPISERKKAKISIEWPNVKISDGDIVTANSIMFLRQALTGQRISIFPEGASCFNILAQENGIWDGYVRPFLGGIKRRLTGPYYKIVDNWLLPDKDGVVRSLVSSSQENKACSSEVLNKNRVEFGKYLIDKLSNDLPNFSHISYVHPIIDELDLEKYDGWVKDISKIVGDSVVMLKKHPRDMRDYRNIFNRLNHVWVPSDYSHLPAEIFITAENIRYVGYYSSLLLRFSAADRVVVSPPDVSVTELYRHEYRGLRSVLGLS